MSKEIWGTTRRAMEWTIVRMAVAAALEDGLKVSVDSGGDDLDRVDEHNILVILDSVFAVDMCSLIFTKGTKPIFTLSIILGNDGYDVISDYGFDDENEDYVNKLLKPAFDVADAFAECKVDALLDYGVKRMAYNALLSQEVHEASYIIGEEVGQGRYSKDHLESAREVADNEFQAQVIWYLNTNSWNDVQCWSTLQLGVRYVTDETGHYYAPDGTYMNADGTRNIFDDVDKA